MEFFGRKLDKSEKTIERYLKAAVDADEIQKTGDLYSLKTSESEPF